MTKQFWRFALLMLILAASFQVSLAQVTPKMSVYTVWTPDEQLDSDGVDERFVDLQIFAQGNVPFWAVNLSCTVGTTALLDFISLDFPSQWGTPSDPEAGDLDGDNSEADYFYSPRSDAALYTGSGVLAFMVTRLGSDNGQLGLNGQDYTQLIATARFKVKESTINTSATVTCSIMDFIDRNGAVVMRGRQTKFNNLMIYTGYTLSGVARRQGTNLNQNIEVTCGLLNDFDNTKKTVFTASNGSYRFAGTSGAPLRDYGRYRCYFESQFVQGIENTQFLPSYIDFELSTATMTLLPVVIRSGDTNNSETITFSDIFSITGGMGATGLTPFFGADMNGDGKIDRLDLVFPAGNMGLIAPNGVLADHVLYGLGRDLPTNVLFPNSRIWLGSANSGDVANFNPRSRARDFWPALSPDGSTIAYVTQDARTGKHSLALLAVATGVVTPIRFPATFTDHAFAPSWSPDGNRIAFICSPSVQADGYGFLQNQGDVCVMNAADRTGAQINRLGVSSKIFAPTWMGREGGFVLLYGGYDGDIHYYDFVSAVHGTLALGSTDAADVVDMPIIVNYTYNDTTYLAYRFNDDDGATNYFPYIRVGTISYDGTVFSGGVTTATGTSTHTQLSVTEGVDFFDVSPSLDIMFYREYNYAVANQITDWADPFTFVTLPNQDSDDDPDLALAWTTDMNNDAAAIKHIPDSSVGNPIGTTTPNGGAYNPVSPSVDTYLHVWRMTFDFAH